jgi:hypothetical protein
LSHRVRPDRFGCCTSSPLKRVGSCSEYLSNRHNSSFASHRWICTRGNSEIRPQLCCKDHEIAGSGQERSRGLVEQSYAYVGATIPLSESSMTSRAGHSLMFRIPTCPLASGRYRGC